jgi:polar amino acid transport system substrate-binding protein
MPNFHITSKRILAILSCLFIVGFDAYAQNTQTDIVTLPWTERQPFQFIDSDGKLKGILFDLGEKIFSKAGVRMKWEEIPAKRILLLLERNQEKICLVGWYMTEERQKIARITMPIYEDRPIKGIVRADSSLKQGILMEDISKNSDINILVKQGYSYGATIDQLLVEKAEKNVQRVFGNHLTLLKMLQLKRADIVFLSQEEIEFYLMSDPNFAKEFSVISFKEIVTNSPRYIICSKQVPLEVITKLNKAIKETIKLK